MDIQAILSSPACISLSMLRNDFLVFPFPCASNGKQLNLLSSCISQCLSKGVPDVSNNDQDDLRKRNVQRAH